MSDASFADIQSEIANILESADELTPEQQALAEEYLAELAQAEADKIDAFASIRRESLDRAEAKRAEAQRLMAQARAIESKCDHFDSYYIQVMQANGLKKVNGKAYSIGLRKSQRVDIAVPIEQLPQEYIRTKTSIEADKAKIKDVLKAGGIIAHCTLQDSFSLAVK